MAMDNKLIASELHDFTPTNYVTLTLKGVISRSILTFCEIPGNSRSDFYHQAFSALVSKADQDNYHLFLISGINSGNDSCELQLLSKQGNKFRVPLTSTCLKGPNNDCMQIRQVIVNYNDQKQNRAIIKTLSQAEEQNPDLLLIHPSLGDIEYVSLFFEQATGALGFISILVSLIPKPRVNLTRFHGGFAPNSKHTTMITPSRRGKSLQQENQTPVEKHRAMAWAQRLKKVFNIEVETGDHRGDSVQVIACIEDQAIIDKILPHLEKKDELSLTPDYLPEARAPPQANLLL